MTGPSFGILQAPLGCTLERIEMRNLVSKRKIGVNLLRGSKLTMMDLKNTLTINLQKSRAISKTRFVGMTEYLVRTLQTALAINFGMIG